MLDKSVHTYMHTGQHVSEAVVFFDIASGWPNVITKQNKNKKDKAKM